MEPREAIVIDVNIQVGPKGFFSFIFDCLRIMVLGVLGIIAFWILMPILLGIVLGVAGALVR